MFFCHLTKGNNFSDYMFASLVGKPSKMGSTLKGKNLLLVEQNSFKSISPLNMQAK